MFVLGTKTLPFCVAAIAICLLAAPTLKAGTLDALEFNAPQTTNELTNVLTNITPWRDYESKLDSYIGDESVQCQNRKQIIKSLNELIDKVPGFADRLVNTDLFETRHYQSELSDDVYYMKRLRRPFHAVWITSLKNECEFSACNEREELLADRWTGALFGASTYVIEKRNRYMGVIIMVVPVVEQTGLSHMIVPLGDLETLRAVMKKDGSSFLDAIRFDLMKKRKARGYWLSVEPPRKTGMLAYGISAGGKLVGTGRRPQEFRLSDSMAKQVLEVAPRTCQMNAVAKTAVESDPAKAPGTIGFNGGSPGSTTTKTETKTTTTPAPNQGKSVKNAWPMPEAKVQGPEARSKESVGGFSDLKVPQLERAKVESGERDTRKGFDMKGPGAVSNNERSRTSEFGSPSAGISGIAGTSGAAGSGRGGPVGANSFGGAPGFGVPGVPGGRTSSNGNGSGPGPRSGDVASNRGPSSAGDSANTRPGGAVFQGERDSEAKGDKGGAGSAAPAKPEPREKSTGGLEQVLNAIDADKRLTPKTISSLIGEMALTSDSALKQKAADVFANYYYHQRGNEFSQNQLALINRAGDPKTAAASAMVLDAVSKAELKNGCQSCQGGVCRNKS